MVGEAWLTYDLSLQHSVSKCNLQLFSQTKANSMINCQIESLFYLFTHCYFSIALTIEYLSGKENFIQRRASLEKSFLVQEGILLLIHGEDNKPGITMFDRERSFIEDILPAVRQEFPSLKIVLEHITTKYAVDFVFANKNVAATITPQHMLFNRNALFQARSSIC